MPHVLPNASAHIVYADTLTGLSTRSKIDNPDDYYVLYETSKIDLLKDTSWIDEIGKCL